MNTPDTDSTPQSYTPDDDDEDTVSVSRIPRSDIAGWLILASMAVAVLAIMLGACTAAEKQVIKDDTARLEACALPAVARLIQCVSAHDTDCVLVTASTLVTCMANQVPAPAPTPAPTATPATGWLDRMPAPAPNRSASTAVPLLSIDGSVSGRPQ